MTETPQTSFGDLEIEAMRELNCILREGTSSERLMRIFALREILSSVSPQKLLQVAADLAHEKSTSQRKAA